MDLYEEIQRNLLGDLSQRESIREYEHFLSKELFNNEEITLIPKIGHDVVNIKIGNEQEQPIYNLGDGIQHIIIITFPLFLHKNQPAILFIEEPELYLHPGLQRRLLELFESDEFENIQVFLTTHSNHFLDITLDHDKISIYNFKKEIPQSNEKELLPKFHIINSSNDDIHLLESLGVRNSSIFLANCTIWVEGITDRFYLRHYLNLYLESINEEDKYKEDYHFSFVEYAGSNITHWSFLDAEEKPIQAERICNRILLISDRDKNKDERHEQIKGYLGDSYIVLTRREIENVISKKVLLEIVKEYEKGNDSNLKTDFTYKGYGAKYLGDFIEKEILIDVDKSARKTSTPGSRPYAAASGTIKDKVSFSKKAIKHMSSIDDLSNDAKDLCEQIYNFIVRSNQDI